ncbi:MAG: flavin reductase family protein [Clostridia bacterium]|nr:flavin reductase family protein [Clostridia bacterium]
MRKNFGSKPVCYPQPVFIIGTYDETGKPDAMNAAWGGISEENEVSICISEDHKTTENVLLKKAFTVSMGTADQLVACDYVGIVSGKKESDKVAKAGWTAVKSEFVDAPLFAQLPMVMECELISYDPASCRLVGKIVNVSADESILNEKGVVDPAKLRPITFDPMNNAYLVLGEKVGNAFSDGVQLK